MGAQRSLPAAAAINWILKDGLGRLGRLSVAARFGHSFDSDLKVCMQSALKFNTDFAMRAHARSWQQAASVDDAVNIARMATLLR